MGRIVSAFLLLAIIFVGFFFLNPKSLSLQSPVPKVFGISKSPVINKWFPKSEPFYKNSSVNLSLSARSAILVDYDSAKVVYAKYQHEKLPVASTVKIMTALVALENSQLSDVFVVSEKAAKIGENSMGLTEKQQVQSL